MSFPYPRYQLITIFILVLFWCLLPSTVKAGPTESEHSLAIEEVKHGSLLFKSDQPNQYLPAPTLRTAVEISVTGLIARATVKQQFKNPGAEWAEGVYVFPLPETAAVDHLRMIIGERIIEGRIQERTQAKKTYNTAKKEGRRASLLEQERPNMFTASVANIGPGETVTVEIEYQEILRYDQGRFHLRFPMVVGPRYIPGQPKLAMGSMKYQEVIGDVQKGDPSKATGPLAGGAYTVVREHDKGTRTPLGPFFNIPGSAVDGNGWAGDTDQVPDASRITPPVQHPDNGSINPVTLTIDLSPGFQLARLESPYHPIQTQHQDGEYTITLQEGSVSADRDFELIWEPISGQAPQAALFSEQQNGETFSLIMILPPTKGIEPTSDQPREVIFVIDTSGSMYGTSIDQAKAALTLALSRLSPHDRFNVIQFNNTTQVLFPQPRPASKEVVRQAIHYVDHLQAEGGTEMLPALQEALFDRREVTGLRQIIFITDGQIGNEAALFQNIQQHVQQSRLFTIGIGSAPNSHFMRKAAEFGRGTFTYVGNTGEVKEKMDRLFRKLEHPALTDIQVEFSSPTNLEMVPERLPDLYVGEPVMIAMKSASLPDTITVNGRIGQIPWRTTLSLQSATQREGMSVYWARQTIDSLMNKQAGSTETESLRQQIIDIALQHHLVSRYTSLVAVDVTPVRSQAEHLRTHALKTNLPQGQDYVAIFGLAQGATPGPIHFTIGLLLLIVGYGLYCLRTSRT